MSDNLLEDTKIQETHNLLDSTDPLTNDQPLIKAQEPQKKEIKNEEQNDIIDPIKQLLENSNVIPLLAIIDQIDLQLKIQGVPLLCILCKQYLPLNSHLKDKQIKFETDIDKRGPLHYAVEADDVRAAYWCLQNKIENYRDNFGNTAIMDAIRLGRRRIFLLCLHYRLYDSQAPHLCAQYNRTWELKVLKALGFDVVSCRNAEHALPLSKAVENYSFQAAEYLASISPVINVQELEKKTDSAAIIRNVKRIHKESTILYQKFLPLITLVLNIIIIYIGTQFTHYYRNSINTINIILLAIEALCLPWIIVSLTRTSPPKRQVNLLRLLKHPQFPVLADICPQCLEFAHPKIDHCSKCQTCVQKFHYHSFVCVSKNNEVFWFAIEFLFLYLAYSLHHILINQHVLQSLFNLHNSTSPFFLHCSIIDYYLTNKLYFNLVWFIYLEIFLVYQILVGLQLIYMMGLNRTYQQIKHSQRYRHLYRIVKNKEGSYKNQQIRISQNGMLGGLCTVIGNIVMYFFR